MIDVDESDPYSMFIFAMNAPQTREKYITRLKRFFDFINLPEGSMQERCDYFVKNGKKNDKWALNNILRFLYFNKERVDKKEITGATLRNYVKAIKLFCDMNDVLVSWKKITRGLPRGRKYADDRAPSLEEIQCIIEYPDRRIKAIVYTMTSSGIRLGAWDYLRWKDIQPLKSDRGAKIIACAGEDEEYFSFITPEAYHELEKWMKYRAQSGEVVNGNSWVLRNIWDTKKGYRRGQISEPAKLKASGVKRLMEDALWTQGLRTKLEPGKRRHEFQTDHGFRKWFKTRCEIAGMKPINIEKLMGHSTGISDSYYRATETELLTDYQNAIEVLTIDNENRLKTELRQLKNEVTTSGNSLMSKLEERNTEINAMQQEDLINKDAIRALSDRITLLIEELERIKSRA